MSSPWSPEDHPHRAAHPLDSDRSRVCTRCPSDGSTGDLTGEEVDRVRLFMCVPPLLPFLSSLPACSNDLDCMEKDLGTDEHTALGTTILCV